MTTHQILLSKSFAERPKWDPLRGLVRYLKGWTAIAFEGSSDSRPSSIVLTVLVAEAFSKEGLADRNLDPEFNLKVQHPEAEGNRAHGKFAEAFQTGILPHSAAVLTQTCTGLTSWCES